MLVSAEALEYWAGLTEQLVATGIALRVNVAVQVVSIDDRTEAIELVDHVVDAVRE